ncbi:hypothetical protein NW762_013650 [Fusarium torreyae]|uniref:FAD/NAD(P)-binding domain-containing protein n=1 Tax=Fusarium torreyae TaxID=1237075 RepID=A0A9W8RPE2_9HYPO|nr:hypothetical protein NW762_013650 [Fusarium torreyae]
MSQKTKHIVIIGGSFAGVKTAHRFLKDAAKKNVGPHKVTLISRDTHFFWNIAAPRAIIPGSIPDEKLFQSIAAGFSQYGSDKFEFVLGTATGIDVNNKQVTVYRAGQETPIGYDYLLIGTGSRTSAGSPYKSRGSTEATREFLHAFQKRVGEAKSIIVAGAGPTGVETAGELANEYGSKKEITLASSGPAVLDNRPESVSKSASSQLQALGVKIKLSTKVSEPVTLPDGRQEVTLSGGEKVVTDLVIPTFGVIPNSSFVPPSLLDKNGFVKVNEYLAVEGREDIFAVGDVSNVEAPQFWFVNKQSAHMGKNFVSLVSGKPLTPYKASTTGMIGVQIAKSGTGHYGNWRLPGFVVAAIRKTLFVEMLPKVIDGTES